SVDENLARHRCARIAVDASDDVLAAWVGIAVGPRRSEPAGAKRRDLRLNLVARRVDVELELATDLVAVRVKQLRHGRVTARVSAVPARIAPNNDELAVREFRDLRMELVAVGVGVDLDFRASGN